MAEKEFKLTDKAKAVVGYLQNAGIDNAEVAQTGKEIAEGMGLENHKGIAGTLRGPVKNEYVDRTEDKPAKYFLTSVGMEASTEVEEAE